MVSRTYGVALAVAALVLGCVGGARGESDLGPPGEAPLVRGVATVTVHGGTLRWDIASSTPKPLRRMHRKDLCTTLTPVATPAAVPTSVCLTARRWATVTRPGGQALRVPASVRRTRQGDARVVLRQADLGIPAGQVHVGVSCAVGCVAAATTVTLPPLVVQACRARVPWLAHSAPADIGKAVAITFDDGPGPMTEQVLDILRAQGVRATFFLIGRMIERNPTILRRIRNEQHVLGNHSFSHPVLTGRDRGQIVRTQRLIRRHGGFDTCLFRAPYGENPPAVVELARRLGMVTVHWNVDPGDWRGLSAAQMVATSLEQTRPGSILVFHDGEDHPDMVAGLPKLLSLLQKRGYRFLTVPELLGLPLRYR